MNDRMLDAIYSILLAFSGMDLHELQMKLKSRFHFFIFYIIILTCLCLLRAGCLNSSLRLLVSQIK